MENIHWHEVRLGAARNRKNLPHEIWKSRPASDIFAAMTYANSVLAPDLHEVLVILFEAGAEDVRAVDVGWSSHMVPAIIRALTMQYILERDTESQKYYSLTEAGYRAIRQQPPAHSSLMLTLKALFGRG